MKRAAKAREGRAALLLGILTGSALLTWVVIRAVQDVALLPRVGSGDPLAQALLGIELTLLTIGILLGGGAILVAWLTATSRLHSRRPAEAVFGLMLLIGLLMNARFYSPGREVGVVMVLLSAGTLLAHLRAESQEHP